MPVALILAGLAVALFIGAYITKRRFGLLGLALTAGATLSTIWDYDAGLLVSATGLVPPGSLTTAVTLSIITLLPAVVLLFHGYTYKEKFARAVGAALFALLAVAFLVEPLQYILTLEGQAAQVYNWVLAHRGAIISIGVVLAIIDLFFTKPAPLAEKKSGKK